MQKTTDIRAVRNVEDLLGYFAGKLGWNVDPSLFESIDDISYDFTAADLGLADDAFAKIRTLRQLRPFDGNQKWAMFCIEFDSRKFEVSAIRKILSELVPRRRKDPNRPVWNMRDILFLCDWGGGTERTIGLAHFEQRESGAPEVKLVSCAPAAAGADPQELRVFEERLSGLAWPRNTADTREWAAAWSSAFKTVYRENIRKASELTQKLAEEACKIRDRILAAMSVESANGYVHLLWKKFRETLVADMSESDFADMYAQTIVYGLFSARCMDKTVDDFTVAEAVECIPKTNPFLKQLMKDCLGVRSSKTALSFDELEIGDVVDLLLHTDIREVVRDFNRQTNQGREDPVIHFYEEFLDAYDHEKKDRCGVFYTPQPVVHFIVRAVDDILRRDFGLADGLASTETREIRPDPSKRKTETVPAVQILDPATGTGTFLRQAILKIHETFRAKHADEGEDAIRAAWNDYVPCHLLPRLNAFELMMAPYAVAHMKLAMVLKDTGYDFKGDERLRVYLTNSLEEPGDSDPQGRLFDDDPLAIESIAANAVKKNTGINVVIGNPPYSGISQNNGDWITKMVNDYKYTDGVYFGEKKHWLNDDYVKFIRLGQEFVTRGGSGVLAYISNHAFLDNPTFRAMRWNLLKSYDELYVVNLHGNSIIGETSPDGCKDENVFDIQQGVSINIFVRNVKNRRGNLGRMFYMDVFGDRETKYQWLLKNDVSTTQWREINYSAPYYFFKEQSDVGREKYQAGFSLPELLPINVMGVTSARDSIVVDIDKGQLLSRIVHFCDERIGDDQIRAELFPGKTSIKYLPGDTRGWNLAKARKLIANNVHPNMIMSIAYRPFDNRYIYYCPEMVDWDRFNVMKHFILGDNIGLCAIRINRDDLCTYLPVRLIADKTIISSKDNANVFPLYLYQEWNGKMQKEPNLNSEIVSKIEKSLGEKTTPEDLFDYIYAVLHSPTYRKKYKEFLKIDFPRIPYPSDAKSFHTLAALGSQLVAIHTMKDFDEADDVAFEDAGGREVGKVSWRDGAAYINKNSRFTNVDEATFNQYIGGYQPLQKWLKDRKGRALSDDDISHWKRIVRALRRTADLMSEIDRVRIG